MLHKEAVIMFKLVAFGNHSACHLIHALKVDHGESIMDYVFVIALIMCAQFFLDVFVLIITSIVRVHAVSHSFERERSFRNVDVSPTYLF